MRGKTAVITGASAGIGEELAVALAERGAQLVLAARSEELLARVKQRCEQAGGQALVVPTDVGDPEACRRLVARAVEAFGGIDYLVNNAGLTMRGLFEDVTDLSLFERLMRVNYLGSVYCTHEALPHVKARRGMLVAISSLTGKNGVPGRTGYSASKHAMQGFFDSLRIELRGTGVDVLVVSPGFVATDIRVRALGPDGTPGKSDIPEETHGMMSVRTCADIILRAMERREREVVMMPAAKLIMALKAFVPGVLDSFAARTMKKMKQVRL
ncbi:SDR family oxidoreductase [Vitiosangium sp. GDMCC 1.1324]|uniref:SDR family oxidoreductase n=1 Tax=Vitiosangium sp. (strain GDMCC 1.1324) TaxID=2138576 RepID=UPI000D3D5D0F|nr:SDR family oxidoreductase [Vitiosangium sp. GDMCC 1.1324]PTL84027.1 short chain dehydrogenase [Vitiosangium sp. GDMCC 1.1324]